MTRDKLKIFQEHLPYKDEPYIKKNWGNAMHSLCSYQGKLKPAIAYHLIKEFTAKGEMVLDPFCGIGTIPFEACLQERQGIGIDINPIAYANTIAKISILDQNSIHREIEKLSMYISNNSINEEDWEMVNIKLPINNGIIADYYHNETLKEILLARKYFLSLDYDSPELNFVKACVLHILHGNRPYALSKRSNNQTPLKPRVDEVAQYKNLVEKLNSKANRMIKSLHYGESFVKGRAIMDSLFNINDLNGQIDIIITSPPFADSTKFYSSNWLRLWFCGWDSSNFDGYKTQFIDYRQKQNFDITYDEVFNYFYRVLKPNGRIILHLGKTNKIDMGRKISEILLQNSKFDILGLVEENVGHCNKHGIRDQGSTTEHQFLFISRK